GRAVAARLLCTGTSGTPDRLAASLGSSDASVERVLPERARWQRVAAPNPGPSPGKFLRILASSVVKVIHRGGSGWTFRARARNPSTHLAVASARTPSG